MPESLLENNIYLRAVIDAIPSLVFIMDTNLKILDANRTAKHVLGTERELILSRLCGEALHCIHQATPQHQCGQTDFCDECILRVAVTKAGDGKSLFREKYRFIHRKDGIDQKVVYLVTASPVIYESKSLILMVLEDVTELTALRHLSTVCSNCFKMKNENGDWESIHDYITRRENILLSHGLCEECTRSLFPELVEKLDEDNR